MEEVSMTGSRGQGSTSLHLPQGLDKNEPALAPHAHIGLAIAFALQERLGFLEPLGIVWHATDDESSRY